MIQQVSDFELELMKVIWENGGVALYAEIVEALEQKGISTTKNTIVSLLSRLVRKGYLATNKIGRRNKYTACISVTEYQAMRTEELISKVYGGDVKSLVSTLLQEDYISSEDREKLKKHWENGTNSWMEE